MFLGFDLSTQQLKVAVLDRNQQVLDTFVVSFDSDLPEFKTKKGVHQDGDEITAPVELWLRAIDLLFSRMQQQQFPFDQVVGVCGSAQQHGSVYWNDRAGSILANLRELGDLRDALSWPSAPNWQDHSTNDDVREFESRFGLEKLVHTTGSRSYTRFTGPQIRKFIRTKPEVYRQTARISLISSFLTSVFVGRLVGIEESDACGMNLYDIPNRCWSDELLSICSFDEPDALRQKLGCVIPVEQQKVGLISRYFVAKYGFSPDCHVNSFTGDNLSTIISLPLLKDEILVSLGTSTTVLLVTDQYKPNRNYNLFIHPTLADHYMIMICYCNGSLAREEIRDQLHPPTWDRFDEILDRSKFAGQVGCYFKLNEIVPYKKAQVIRGVYRDNEFRLCERESPEQDVQTIVVSQAISCKLRSSVCLSITQPDSLGLARDLVIDDSPITSLQLSQRPAKCVFVGGGSRNQSILNKFATVLNGVENFRFDNSNSCAIGGAFKAFPRFSEVLEEFDYSKLIKFEPQCLDGFADFRDGFIGLEMLEQRLA